MNHFTAIGGYIVAALLVTINQIAGASVPADVLSHLGWFGPILLAVIPAVTHAAVAAKTTE